MVWPGAKPSEFNEFQRIPYGFHWSAGGTAKCMAGHPPCKRLKPPQSIHRDGDVSGVHHRGTYPFIPSQICLKTCAMAGFHHVAHAGRLAPCYIWPPPSSARRGGCGLPVSCVAPGCTTSLLLCTLAPSFITIYIIYIISTKSPPTIPREPNHENSMNSNGFPMDFTGLLGALQILQILQILQMLHTWYGWAPPVQTAETSAEYSSRRGCIGGAPSGEVCT